MVKLGVYIASHNNPMFLRMVLLQLEAQTYRPDAVAIHENGHPESALMSVCGDVIGRLKRNGIKVYHDHTPAGLAHPFFHYLPLKRLVEAGCQVFTKMDHDDIFYAHHLRRLWDALTWYQIFIGIDEIPRLPWSYYWVGRSHADILILNPKQYSLSRDINFGQFNPLGGMSDGFMFTRDVAVEYMKDMEARAGSGEADDWILTHTLAKFKGNLFYDDTTTACYVSHGRNDSTSHWIRQAPPELKVVDNLVV